MSDSESPKLKLAFITPYFYPVRGGTENNCLNMGLQTIKYGHEVEIFTSDRKAGNVFGRKEEDFMGIKIHRLFRFLFSQYYLTFLPNLPRRLLKGDFDVIHTNIPGVFWTDFSLMLVKLFRRKKTVFVNTPHDPFMSRNNYGFFENLLRSIFIPILKLYYSRLYDYVIAVNPNQREWIKNLYGVPEEKIVYVSNGVNEDLFEDVEIDNALKEQYEITDQVVITMVARYHEYKGYQKVLEALTKIRNKKQLNIKFFGIGQDSGMLSRLRNYIEDQKLDKYATLIESPNDTVRDQLLEISEIFILASRVEAFGIAIVEGMAKGNAIISTKTEGGLYLIKPQNGVLYDFEDTDALAEAIIKLASDNQLRQSMIGHNYKYAKKFLWSKTYIPYKELILDKIQQNLKK